MSAPPRGRFRPAPQAGLAVWTTTELSPADWMVPVGAEDAAELEAALAALQGRAPGSPGEVALPRLALALGNVAARLDTGRGFVVLRGLPFDRHGPAAAEAALLALGAHLGTALPGEPGDAGPITRLTSPVDESWGSTAGPPRFHADACDVVALLCLASAPGCPPTVLVSAGAVHNEVMRRDRAALEELYRPVPLMEGERVVEGAVFRVIGGAFSGRYTRDAIEAAAASALPGAPPPPAGLRPALDLLDQVSADPALALRLETRPGDLLCFNPHLVWKRRSLEPAAGDAPPAPQEFRRLRLATRTSRTAPAEAA